MSKELKREEARREEAKREAKREEAKREEARREEAKREEAKREEANHNNFDSDCLTEKEKTDELKLLINLAKLNNVTSIDTNNIKKTCKLISIKLHPDKFTNPQDKINKSQSIDKNPTS